MPFAAVNDLHLHFLRTSPPVSSLLRQGAPRRRMAMGPNVSIHKMGKRGGRGERLRRRQGIRDEAGVLLRRSSCEGGGLGWARLSA